MRWIAVVLAALVLAGSAWALGKDHCPPPGRKKEVTSRRMTLEQTVGPEAFRQAGLEKLTPEEQFVLADWIRDYTVQITKYVEEQCRREAQPAAPGPVPQE